METGSNNISFRIMFENYPEYYVLLSTWNNNLMVNKFKPIVLLKKYYNSAKFKITPEELPECVRNKINDPWFILDVMKAIEKIK